MNITFRQLEIFAGIAAQGNVTKASEELLISQSAASMALAEFEKQIGERLFNRSGKRLILNEQGRILLPKVMELLTRIEEIEGLFSKKGENLVGKINIGASSTIGNYLLPALLGDFTEQFPGVQLRLDVGNTDQIIQSLLGFKIDIGYIEGLCHHAKVHTYPWRKDQLVIFTAPSHPLTGKTKLTLKDLAAARWILRERGSGTRRIFENALAGKLDHIHIALELGHTEAIKQAIKSNVGISCLSRLAVAESLGNGSLVELKTPFLDLHRNFYCLIHEDAYQTQVLKTLINFL